MNELQVIIYYPQIEVIQAVGYWVSMWSISGLIGYNCLMLSNILHHEYEDVTYERPVRHVVWASVFGPLMFFIATTVKKEAERRRKILQQYCNDL